MRVALLSYNAQVHNAVGNHVAEKVRFFLERGAEVRVFVQDARRLHPDVRSSVRELAEPSVDGQAWEFLRQADLIFAVYGQYYDLLQYLPRLAGTGPRIVFDYLGVTPPRFWRDQHRDDLEKASQMRGYVWCADHALTISSANRRELLDATNFPEDHVKTLPIAVDVERFRPGANGRFLQRKLGIDGRALLYVGRLACNKRVPLLIEALALLARSTSEEPVHVVIVGDCRDVYAEEAARCVALAKELGIERRVHFVGELDDAELPLAYQSADALVMPSLHEGFCVPVIEAMAAGCPVIAARTSALPETAGDAGLTFTPDDADDLASQIRRVLDPAPLRPSVAPYRIAVVSFRFGPDIVGGAETSLRTMASALQQAGHHVEVFTTCTTTESNWANELSPGTMTLAGLKVHRFPIDPHDHAEHGEIVRAILDSHGNVAPALDDRYLHLSIHSAGLVEALRARQAEYDAILTGPYLFGLSADIAREFPRQTLIVPCFHDEPLAHLLIWPRLYGNAAGIMYHTMEEQQLAQGKFGVNHPNSTVIGTFIAPRDNSLAPLPEVLRRPYIVYCGRYSLQKNVPLLLEWVERYQKSHPSQLDVVFMGQGDLQLPSAPWLHDLGRVDEITKRSVLKNAAALVQLSRQESLSLVALEAWAEKTPIIVHRDCAVLVGQVERSGGGAVVGSFGEFAEVLDHWLAHETTRRRFGANGHAYVEQNYLSSDAYANRITKCIARLQAPMHEQMRERGLERASGFARARWQGRFADFVEQVLTQPARVGRSDVLVEPLRSSTRATPKRTVLVPVRLSNRGTHAAAPDGPGRTVVCFETRSATSGTVVLPCAEARLSALVMPGQSQVMIVPIETPAEEGVYHVHLWTEQADKPSPNGVAQVTLMVEEDSAGPDSSLNVFLDEVGQTLAKTHALQELPADYVDVTEGTFAPLKRLIKKKLLHNFKHAYVDVMSRQQSQVNRHLVLMIQQLAECCALLDQRVAALESGASADSGHIHGRDPTPGEAVAEEESHY